LKELHACLARKHMIRNRKQIQNKDTYATAIYRCLLIHSYSLYMTRWYITDNTLKNNSLWRQH
jgi:hypothetical protein